MSATDNGHKTTDENGARDDVLFEFERVGCHPTWTSDNELEANCPICDRLPDKGGTRMRVLVGDGLRVYDCPNGCAQHAIDAMLDALTGHARASLYPPPEPARSSSPLRQLDTLRMLMTDPQPLEWLVDGIFARGHHTLFGGREKRGKSLVQMVFAVTMASGGGTVAGIAVKPGRVLIIDAENGERMIHRRLRSVMLNPSHADNLIVHEARGFDLLRDLGLVDELVRQHNSDLVLLDSFRALWTGNERDEAEVTEALQPVTNLAHDLDVAVGLTHHQQKGGDEYRGSSAVGACPDWIVRLDRIEGDPRGKTRRRLANTESRVDRERDDRWLEISSQSEDGPITLVEADPYEYEPETPVQNGIEVQLRALVKAGCTSVTAYVGEDTSTPSWTLASLARAVGRDSKDRMVRKALDALVTDGVLQRGDDRRYRPVPTPVRRG